MRGPEEDPRLDEKTIDRVAMTSLQHQCGLVFRSSENFMFGTGTQPFVVKIEVE